MGYRVKEYREQRNMTQEELERRSGVSRQTIAALESGKSKNVFVGTLAAIAKALDTTVDDFFCKQCSND